MLPKNSTENSRMQLARPGVPTVGGRISAVTQPGWITLIVSATNVAFNCKNHGAGSPESQGPLAFCFPSSQFQRFTFQMVPNQILEETHPDSLAGKYSAVPDHGAKQKPNLKFRYKGPWIPFSGHREMCLDTGLPHSTNLLWITLLGSIWTTQGVRPGAGALTSGVNFHGTPQTMAISILILLKMAVSRKYLWSTQDKNGN